MNICQLLYMHMETSFHLILILKIYEIDAITSFHFTDGKNEVHRSYVTHPESRNLKMAGKNLNSGLSAQGLSL